jgi:hypothetical protein
MWSRDVPTNHISSFDVAGIDTYHKPVAGTYLWCGNQSNGLLSEYSFVCSCGQLYPGGATGSGQARERVGTDNVSGNPIDPHRTRHFGYSRSCSAAYLWFARAWKK